MEKIGILYICTGKYIEFWQSFYESSQKHFLLDDAYEKHYFVFTDSETIAYGNESFVHKIYQKPLAWPFITLHRFKIFNSVSMELENMDYLYFFNANMLFISNVDSSFLPDKNQNFSFVKHPGFFNKAREKYTYDNNPKSLAYVSMNEGEYYFMGGLNGGFKTPYLDMIRILERNIDVDEKNSIIALWHDESHLNRFAIDHHNEIKVLDSSYGYAEDWNLPFDAKIIIRDKDKFGGHYFLRGEKPAFKPMLKLKSKLKNILSKLKLNK